MTKHEANKTKAVNSGPAAAAGAAWQPPWQRRDLKNAAETKTSAKSFGPPLAAGSRRVEEIDQTN